MNAALNDASQLGKSQQWYKACKGNDIYRMPASVNPTNPPPL